CQDRTDEGFLPVTPDEERHNQCHRKSPRCNTKMETYSHEDERQNPISEPAWLRNRFLDKAQASEARGKKWGFGGDMHSIQLRLRQKGSSYRHPSCFILRSPLSQPKPRAHERQQHACNREQFESDIG